jgi:hypothetical protein
MAQKKKTDKQAGYAALYKTTGYARNRRIKLERTIKEQPNNEMAKIALKNIVYRRKTPGDKGWSATEIAIAKSFKLFTGSFNRKVLEKDPKVSQPALAAPGKHQIYDNQKPMQKLAFKPPQGLPKHESSMFKLGVRAHNKGVAVWS